MEIDQLTSRLRQIFGKRSTRVVFWYDPEEDFPDMLPEMHLEGVEVINLDGVSALEVKTRIELGPTEHKYLLYSAAEAPKAEDDWLCDIRLYSQSFRADRASMVMRELGLAGEALRLHVSARLEFFRSKHRAAKLKFLVSDKDTGLDLDRKMLAVVVGASHAEPFTIVRTLLHSIARDADLASDTFPPSWAQVKRFELDDHFWLLAKQHFCYEAESPSFPKLVSRMFVTDLGYHLDGKLPSELQGLQLKDSGAHNTIVFLAQWRDSGSSGKSYNWWAEQIWRRLEMAFRLRRFAVDDIMSVVTFAEVEDMVAQGIADRIAGNENVTDVEHLCRLIDLRKQGHWVISASVPEARRKARAGVYEALAAGAKLLQLQRTHSGGFGGLDASELYRLYEHELFRFDQLYRHFSMYANAVGGQGTEILQDLHSKVENCYRWFLEEIALAWNRHIDARLSDRWTFDAVLQQQHFFSNNIDHWLRGGPKRRAFVIVSDALRYEIAQELKTKLDKLPRILVELASQLGVLPSYTALGMASLLPHEELSYSERGEVLVDGRQSASLQQRDTILRDFQKGKAVSADMLLPKGRKEGRNFIVDARVVYVYHDKVDAAGDSPRTESDTFAAADRAIEELVELTKYVVNSLNASYVVITADHGFVYTNVMPEAPDRSRIADQPAGTVVAKKRYLLGRDLPSNPDAWCGDTRVTAGASGSMQFWIPKGYNLFHFSGGARFFHGGAMLQEIVVPVITVRKRPDKIRPQPVQVQVVGTRFRITTKQHRFTLLQTEAVSERVVGVTLKVAVCEAGQPVTDIKTVRLASSSENLAERQQDIVLTLRSQEYDKRTSYQLELTDAETGVLAQTVPVTIDRAFDDDF